MTGGNLKISKKLDGGWGGGRSASPPDASQPVGCWLFVVASWVFVFFLGRVWP